MKEKKSYETKSNFEQKINHAAVNLSSKPHKSDAECTNPEVCLAEADKFYRGIGGKTKDLKKARRLFEQACKAGNAEGCNWLAYMYLKGEGGVQIESRSQALYEKACKLGSPAGCNNLGYMYEKGTDGIEYKNKAIALYKRACENGYAVGCYNLGLILQKEGAIAESLEQFEKSCTLGDKDACTIVER